MVNLPARLSHWGISGDRARCQAQGQERNRGGEQWAEGGEIADSGSEARIDVKEAPNESQNELEKDYRFKFAHIGQLSTSLEERDFSRNTKRDNLSCTKLDLRGRKGGPMSNPETTKRRMGGKAGTCLKSCDDEGVGAVKRR